MADLTAQIPGWVQYVAAMGFVLVVLSRVILAADPWMRTTPTGLFIGDASVTIAIMLSLAVMGADDRLLEEFVVVFAIGATLFVWDLARLSARRRSTLHTARQSVQASDIPGVHGTFN